MDIVILPEVDSTNSYVKRNAPSLATDTLVGALTQSAGRGQRGNSWEAEPGANLTFSLFKRFGEFPANRQFRISEAVALAVVDYLAAHGVQARIKWPNDIYVDDLKICGILIEHSIMGTSVMHSIIGVGINVNQRRFLSDAPNPVSLSLLTGKEYDIAEEYRRIASALERRLSNLSEGVHAEFRTRMWRGSGVWSWRDAATEEVFEAEVADVEPMGHLCLKGADNALRRYAFKEVFPVI